MSERTNLFQVYHTHCEETGGIIYDFNLCTQVVEPEKYVELLQVLRNAKCEDTVNIYLNTTGGRIDTMIQIINCMKKSKAHIITHLEGLCHSAGTFIFLSGDSFVVNPDTLLLFHNYSGGSWGKGNEVVQEVIATDSWIKVMANDIYYPFLSIKEIDSLFSGRDMWMNSDDVLRRLEKVLEVRETKTEQENVEARKQLFETLKEAVKQDKKQDKERKKIIKELEEEELKKRRNTLINNLKDIELELAQMEYPNERRKDNHRAEESTGKL